MSAYPEWMHKLVEVDEARKAAEAAAQAEADAQAAAMQRLLGENLVEVLAFLLDVALPAPETNEVELDGVKFALGPHDVEPIVRDEAGNITNFHFTLVVRAGDGNTFLTQARAFQFGSLIGVDLAPLAAHVLTLVSIQRALGALDGLTVGDLLDDCEAANPVVANAAHILAADFELHGLAAANTMLGVALDHGDRVHEAAVVRDYLLSLHSAA
jgi:hypothetical protein